MLLLLIAINTNMNTHNYTSTVVLVSCYFCQNTSLCM